MVKAYADLYSLPEDKRIKVIAEVAASGNLVGVFVDDDVAADRYIKKLKAYPVRIVDRRAGVVKNTVFIRVGPKES